MQTIFNMSPKTAHKWAYISVYTFGIWSIFGAIALGFLFGSNATMLVAIAVQVAIGVLFLVLGRMVEKLSLTALYVAIVISGLEVGLSFVQALATQRSIGNLKILFFIFMIFGIRGVQQLKAQLAPKPEVYQPIQPTQPK